MSLLHRGASPAAAHGGVLLQFIAQCYSTCLPFQKHQLENLSSRATCYLNSPLRGTNKVHVYPTVILARSLST